jgi:hypothetical protein
LNPATSAAAGSVDTLTRNADKAPSSPAAFVSAARVGSANCALLTGDGTVDRRSVSEHIKEPSLGSFRNLRETEVPVPEEHPQLVAQLGEIAEAGFQFGEPLRHQRANAPTRRAATLTFRQGRRQIVKREANRQRTPHQSDAPDRFGWVEAIAALAASRDPEDPLALVVPQRILLTPVSRASSDGLCVARPSRGTDPLRGCVRDALLAMRCWRDYLGCGVVFLCDAVSIILPRMPCCIIPPFFIIAACIAAIPSLTKSVTSEACCWSAATVSWSDDV